MKSNRYGLCLAIFLVLSMSLLLPLGAQAQDQPSEGVTWGDYNVKQSIELGWRFTGTSDHNWITGNQDVYETFVNLRQGARVLNQSLEMRSLDHKGLLFDDFFMSNFGYGGDPNQMTMVRASKNKWYDFSGNYRRDRNLWNYNLLANPLNPVGSKPTVPITFSPHLMRLSRRMTDLNLVLLPQSRVRFRLGYTRNISDGPSLSSLHQGTDTILFQDWKTTLNSYQVGVDFKPWTRTNISYDQFLQYYKGDTSWVDNNLTYQLADGTPVDLGIIFDTANRSPCASPIKNSTTSPPTANPTCNSFLAYDRSAPGRTKFPTEQLSFQSSSVKNLDMSGRFVYSSSDMNVLNFNDFFNGYESRTSDRQYIITGPASAKRVSVSTDFAATYNFTPKFRLIEEYRFWNFRIPGQWVSSETAWSGTGLNVPPTNPETTTAVSSLFIGQNIQLNTVQLAYDFNRRFGARLGYRYRHRTITQSDLELADQAFASFGSMDTVINEHSLLAGIWARPIDSLRLSYDMELMSADNTFTRIDPRQMQRYKLRATYKPMPWLSFGGTMTVHEARNNVVEIDHLQHNRSYGFNTTVAPNDRWALDLGVDHNNVFSTTNICYAFVGVPPTGNTPCPILASGVASLAAISVYDVTTDSTYADIMVKPVKRLTMNLGYTTDKVSGDTLILNPNAFAGPLQSSYTKPYASLAFDVVKGWTAKGAWGFYNYHEQAAPTDFTAPRGFRGNMLTLSFIYSF